MVLHDFGSSGKEGFFDPCSRLQPVISDMMASESNDLIVVCVGIGKVIVIQKAFILPPLTSPLSSDHHQRVGRPPSWCRVTP